RSPHTATDAPAGRTDCGVRARIAEISLFTHRQKRGPLNRIARPRSHRDARGQLPRPGSIEEECEGGGPGTFFGASWMAYPGDSSEPSNCRARWQTPLA